MKSYTDLSQSKKLAKILPIESADMFYRDNGIDVKLIWEHNAQNVKSPCWSLAALINILPKGTRLLKSATDNTYHCDCPKGNIGKWYDNPVDACVDMICKLKERN